MARTVIMLCAALPLIAGPAFADSLLIGDMNADGVVDFFDIDCFVEILMGGEISHAGPIDYWPLDGLARDYGGYRNHGTLAGDTAFSDDVPPAVVVGESLSFDGDGDYVHLGTSLLDGQPFSEFTFQAWFKAGAQTDVHATMFSNETTDGEFSIFIWGEGLEEPLLNAVVYFEGYTCSLWGPPVTDDRWHHVALRVGAGEAALFLDGQLWDSCAGEGPLGVNGLWHAAIGCKYTSTAHGFFTGLIDEVKLHDYALPSAAIAAESSLVAYWMFDEGDGTAVADQSGHGNQGTVDGATWAPGIIGSALSFDGTDDYVVVPNSASLANMGANMSITAWINITPGTIYDVYDHRQIVCKGAVHASSLAADYAVNLSKPEGQLQFEYSHPDIGFIEAAGDPIPQGEWHFVAVTFDRGTVRYYMDGQLIETLFGPYETIRTSTHPLYIGCRYLSPFVGPFAGLLDEIRIYNRTLTPVEVQKIANP